MKTKKGEDLETGSIPQSGEEDSFLKNDKCDLDEVWSVSSEQDFITKILPVTQVEGNHLLFYGSKRGDNVAFPTHCIMGPDYVCSFLTSFLIIGPNLVWFKSAVHNLNLYLILIGVVLGSALLMAYSKTAYSDPGIVKKLTKEEFLKLPKQSNPVCRICNVYRELGTRHCFDCDCCIEGICFCFAYLL